MSERICKKLVFPNPNSGKLLCANCYTRPTSEEEGSRVWQGARRGGLTIPTRLSQVWNILEYSQISSLWINPMHCFKKIQKLDQEIHQINESKGKIFTCWVSRTACVWRRTRFNFFLWSSDSIKIDFKMCSFLSLFKISTSSPDIVAKSFYWHNGIKWLQRKRTRNSNWESEPFLFFCPLWW